MSEEAPQREKQGGWYFVARVLAAVLFRVVFPVRYLHAERLDQAEPPFILISNHDTLLDPLVIAAPVKKHAVYFLGKKEITSNRLLAYLTRKLHMIPVDRHHSDMAAMRTCVSTLRSGHILGIFPEGTRHHQGRMQEMESGTAMIALRSGVPLIPVLIDPKLHFLRRSWCYAGKPIPMEDLLEAGINRDTCEQLMQRIRDTYQVLAKELEQEKSKKTKKNSET